MNSLDIARITGKRHDNVKRDILLKNAGIKPILNLRSQDSKIWVYELTAPQIEELTYSKEIFQYIKIQDLENKVYELEEKVKRSDVLIEILQNESKNLKNRIEVLERIMN